MKRINEKRVQYEVHRCANRNRDHSHLRIALGTNIVIKPGACHEEKVTEHINHEIASGIGICCFTCSQCIQHWAMKQQEDKHDHDGPDDEKPGTDAHDPVRLLIFPLTAKNRENRCATHRKPVRKGGDQHD